MYKMLLIYVLWFHRNVSDLQFRDLDDHFFLHLTGDFDYDAQKLII
jgi:hypothetical protein